MLKRKMSEKGNRIPSLYILPALNPMAENYRELKKALLKREKAKCR